MDIVWHVLPSRSHPALVIALRVDGVRQSRMQRRRTKKVLQCATFSYVLLLLLVCVLKGMVTAMLINLAALGLGLATCSSSSMQVRVIGQDSGFTICMYGIYRLLFVTSRGSRQVTVELCQQKIYVQPFPHAIP